MRERQSIPEIDRIDCLVAWMVGIAGLALYTRTLAPDVLYGDSGEFQTLTYTLGTTHSTGYPIYLLLARVVGFLPLGNLAWRVNLFSALCAAGTLSVVYLLGRNFTESRVGPVLGSLALASSYTFWSQAIIAEVYTPAMFFLATITLLLWRWHHDPDGRGRSLFFAALLSGLGLGVHASIAFVAPAAVIFVLWTMRSRRADATRRNSLLLAAIAGAGSGLAIYTAAFLLIDLHHPPSSFIRVTLYPSRSIWNLTPADLDSPLERMFWTVTGLQWRDAMFTTPSFVEMLRLYLDQAVFREFSVPLFLLALFGLVAMWRSSRLLGAYTLLVYLTSLYLILSYNPPDKYVFYLSTYLWIVTAIGAGAGFLMEQARQLASRAPWLKNASALVFSFFPALLLTIAVLGPCWESRWQAVRDGKASFVKEDYVYPINDLDEPRGVAGLLLPYLPDNAIVMMDWRDLYSTYYIAHVEQGRTDIILLEAMPHGNIGQIADSLVQELKAATEAGRPVFSVSIFPGVRKNFRVLPGPGSRLYRLSLP